MAWHVVVLKHSSFTALGSAMTRKGSFPDADYGTTCLCCDQSTTQRMLFDPSAQHSATPIRIPACADCVPHISKGNNEAMTMLVLLGIGILLLGLSWKNGEWLAIPGVLSLVAMGGVWWHGQRQRAAMAARGHRNGLEIVAIPGLVSVRTTNPRFARELRERNPALCAPRD